MAVKSIDILNLMVFQKRNFHLEFADGMNVLIGENGVGKTTLLKMIYTAAQWSGRKENTGNKARLLQYFSNRLDTRELLGSTKGKEEQGYYRVSDGKNSAGETLTYNEAFWREEGGALNIPSVFIPTTEMLSHTKGFLALNQKYHMPFDGTQVDIIMNASLPETREIPESVKGILDKIGAVIDGTVIMENDSFYVVKTDGRKVDFSLEAEGLRKLGLLWKLIRSGLLENGTVLLWDEPEANLNPELYPLAAEILLELQRTGVQIFVATHSYNFAKYLEIRRREKGQVLFHNLYREEEYICSQSAYRMEDMKQNHIMIADNKLLDEVYDM